MFNSKNTKRSLLMSALAIVLCVSMLVGSTFAWFTDTATTGVNTIQSGTLDIELLMYDGANWVNAENQTLNFISANGNQNILWEPGCTYELPALKVVNNGNLSLKYQIHITGIEGDAKLLEVIDFTIENEGSLSGTLAPEAETAAITLIGSMSKDANNDYQGLTLDAISITVVATQMTAEFDSYDNQYDALATYMNKNADGEWEIDNLGQLIYFAKSVNEGNSYAGETVVLTNDIDLAGINWIPIGNADADEFVGFKGTFDGQNFTISNLTINSASWGKGLFGYMDINTNATVKNVNIHNANVVATDCAGIIVGYATNGTFENIHVTGDVSVVATVNDGYAGGIAGCGYNADFNNCSVIANAGSKITSAGSFAGGIVGYQCNNQKMIADCKVANLTITGYGAIGGIAGIIQTGPNFAFTNNTVENIVLNKSRVDGNPSIGALVGCYSGTEETKLTGVVSNVTLNGTHVAYSAYNALYGSNYGGATTPNFDVTGVAVSGITNNLVEVVVVKNATELQAALDTAVDGTVIHLVAGITGDVTATQKPDIKVTIEGNGMTYAGVITVDGKSGTYTTAGLTIKNVNFKADSISADACINLGNGNNATRYTCNVTVDGCTFDVPGAVGVKSYTGGDKNLRVIDCTATSAMHSLVQLAGIDGVLIEGCTVNSKNGANFNQSDNVTISGCTFDTQGYAARFGASSGNTGAAETYLIKACSLKSANDDGDATIILRGTADNSTLTIQNTTIVGTPDIVNNATGATVNK